MTESNLIIIPWKPCLNTGFSTFRLTDDESPPTLSSSVGTTESKMDARVIPPPWGPDHAPFLRTYHTVLLSDERISGLTKVDSEST